MRQATKRSGNWTPTAPNSLTPRLGLQIDGIKPARSQKIEEARRQKQEINTAVEAGQLAVGQYATPHTRQSADIAAQTVRAALAGRPAPISELFAEGVVDIALLNARDALGQYYQPHARQAAKAAAASILIQCGHIEQGEQ